MNLVQRSLAKTLQNGSVEIRVSDDAVVVPLVAARRTVIRQSADGSLTRTDRNWTMDEARSFVRQHERWLLFGWLRHVPVARRWAPWRPMSGNTDVGGLTVTGPLALKGPLEGIIVHDVQSAYSSPWTPLKLPS